MSHSIAASNLTTVVSRDSLPTAIVKNMITVVLSISVIFINGTLIHTFRQHQVLSANPRYILYIHLVANDIVMLSMFTLMMVLIYMFFTLNTSFCMLVLVVAILANLNNPLTLAVMALECYVAICFPLHHVQICTVNNAYVAIGLVWVISSLTILPDVFVVLATESLDFFHSRIFCVRDQIFRNPRLKEKRDISYIVLLVLVWLTLVYAYFNILFAAQGATSNARKARNTVLLHGFQLSLCMLTYTYNQISNGLIALFPQYVTDIRFITTILFQVLPRLLSPLIYGLRDKTFRKYVKSSLFCARREARELEPEVSNARVTRTPGQIRQADQIRR
ncbi:odorant receptor 131-2-like [Neosynchiropus ocellatus]